MDGNLLLASSLIYKIQTHQKFQMNNSFGNKNQIHNILISFSLLMKLP